MRGEASREVRQGEAIAPWEGGWLILCIVDAQPKAVAVSCRWLPLSPGRVISERSACPEGQRLFLANAEDIHYSPRGESPLDCSRWKLEPDSNG